MRDKPQLLEMDGGVPEPAQVSELIRDFAQPLLYADPAGPADLDTIRTAMMLAMICWNLPVYEAIGSPLYAQGKRTLAAIANSVPSSVSTKLRKLIRDRKTKFAALPFLVVVEVTGTTLQDASIVAKARTPAPKPSN